ncbi:hypothetical protein ACQKK5_23380 [Brevibacillus panacihumi]|uniref:hypothetical protein n=1 Tax=Brevibacillus panacihumi TaxID=497735 RepID=UPI003D031164
MSNSTIEIHEFINEAIENRIFEGAIFGPFASEDISEENFRKWCGNYRDLLLAEFPPTEHASINEDYEYLIGLVEIPEVWSIIVQIYYRGWLKNNATVFKALTETSPLEHDRFLINLRNYIEEELGTYELHEKEMNKEFLERVYNLLTLTKVFSKIKTYYFGDIFNSQLFHKASSNLKVLNGTQLITNIAHILSEGSDTTQKLNEEEGIAFVSKIVDKKVLRIYSDFLSAQEKKGYIAFQTYHEIIKEMTFSYIKRVLSLQMYIKEQSYPNSYDGFQQLTKSFEYLAPDKILYVYESSFEKVIVAIDDLIISCLMALPFIPEKDGEDKYRKNLIEIHRQSIQKLRSYQNEMFAILTQKFLGPRFNNLDILFNRLINTAENYSNSAKKDGWKALIGGVTGTGLFTLFNIAKRELTIHSKIEKDYEDILSYYNKYLKELREMEQFLYKYYESVYIQVYKDYITPVSKLIFKHHHPIRKLEGISNYEEYLAENINEFKKNFQQYTLVSNLEYKPYFHERAFKPFFLKT